jgi:16S rRNA G966 N2-methylase RsmD
LIDNQWLLDNAIVIVECEKNLKIVCDLELLDTRSQSQSDLHFFRYNTAVE